MSASSGHPERPELTRLIEAGLALYGLGDLDGALHAWEQVLEVEPGNGHANSYVDYVRLNYDLLTGAEAPDAAAQAAFAIASDEAPDHTIDAEPSASALLRGASPHLFAPIDAALSAAVAGAVVAAGAAAAVAATTEPAPAAAVADGWSIDEDPRPRTLDGDAPLAAVAGPEVNFERATREDDAARMGMRPTAAASAAAEVASADVAAAEFGPESTPGFEAPTDVRARELGFVRAPPGPRPSVDVSLDEPVDGPLVPQPPVLPSAALPHRPLGVAALSIEAFELDDAAAPAAADVPVSPLAPIRELPDLPLDHLHGFDLESRPTLQIDPMVSAPTRELGLRPPGGTPAPPASPPTRADIVLAFDPVDARAAQILEVVDAEAPLGEPKEEQTRRRVTALLERATVWAVEGVLDRAVAALDLALSEDPDSALAQKLVQQHRDDITAVFQAFLGELDRAPVLARPMHELASAPISPRAAFLLSRVDGTLTLDEILDVSGMPRLEAYRYLCQLFLRGILR